jgi:DNA-binding SARP family transcriptional activator
VEVRRRNAVLFRAGLSLKLLVRNSGHLLEKDELIGQLWPDSFVEEGNLSNNIFMLRKALGEDSQYIETVPKRGGSELRKSWTRLLRQEVQRCEYAPAREAGDPP